MSEVKTTQLFNFMVEQNSWQNVFPNGTWQDYYRWIRYGTVDVAYEYLLKSSEEVSIEFPFVVKTMAPVKEVRKFNLKMPVKRVNYGTKFTILPGSAVFYYADNFKLPAEALRRSVYELLRAWGNIKISIDLHQIYTNLCMLSSWSRFLNGEWQSCGSWTLST